MAINLGPGEPLSIKTWKHAHAQPETLKSMSPAEFHAFSLRGGDEETNAESAAGPKIPKAACEAEPKQKKARAKSATHEGPTMISASGQLARED